VELTSKEKSVRVWEASPAGSAFGEGATPGTREFFEKVILRRSTYELPWLYEIIPFASFRMQRVLELGCGAGYDAYEFCRYGAYYCGIDIAPSNPRRTREHLALYGYATKVVEGDIEWLPFKDESVDVVFSNGVLHHTPDLQKSLTEGFRVLRHGGQFWMIVYNKHSIFYWVTLVLYNHFLRGGFLRNSLRERLSMIEYTTNEERPLVNVYTGSFLKRLLRKTGFTIENLWIRKLVKEDLPWSPVLIKLWSVIPQQWLDRAAYLLGWYLIVKASKL
jgi:SAM-dependent methyltransferase